MNKENTGQSGLGGSLRHICEDPQHGVGEQPRNGENTGHQQPDWTMAQTVRWTPGTAIS